MGILNFMVTLPYHFVVTCISDNLCPGRQALFDIFLHACMPNAGAISSVFS